jgi:hypothetical protein
MREGDEKRYAIRILVVWAIWALLCLLAYCTFLALANLS